MAELGSITSNPALSFITSNPATDAFQHAEDFAQKQMLSDAALEKARRDNEEAKLTQGSRLRQISAESDLAGAHATEAQAQVPYADQVARAHADQATATAKNTASVGFDKSMEAVKAGNIPLAQTIAKQYGLPDIPPELANDAEMRAVVTNAHTRANEISDNPQYTQSFMLGQINEAQKRREQGLPINPVTQPYTVPPDVAPVPSSKAAPPANYRQNDQGGYDFIPGSPADPAVIRQNESAKRLPGMSDEALGRMVESYRAGNTGVLAGVSKGPQGSENLSRFWNFMAEQMKADGATGRDIAAANANFKAQSAAAIVSAKRESNVAASVEEANQTFPLALQRSAEVPRSQFVPWNKAVQMVQTGTSSPELARFVTANQGVITAYSQAMSRTVTNSVNPQQHAEQLLSTATSQEAYAAVIEQMKQEMQAALVAPDLVRDRILRGISGRSDAGAPTGSPGAPAPGVPQGNGRSDVRVGPPLIEGKDQGRAPTGSPGAPAPSSIPQSAPVRVQTPDEARTLPPGTHFITPDGREFVR